MPQFLLKADELRQLLETTTKENRLLITIDSLEKDATGGTITAKAVTFQNGQLTTESDEEVIGCPYPPGCD